MAVAKPPTKNELALALYAVSSAYDLLRGFIENGKLEPHKFETFFSQIGDLRNEFGGDWDDPGCFFSRADNLDDDHELPGELA